ncbi:MAG: glycosyltransferase [Mesorhizobium sp.]|uniref:glycosyltransferase n=1 Tax=Mesorhizobium sp. TaxID=1871066 RepID=UPI000FE70C1F|nr:glycosyltransferase [Mesorhizobium sp.]RWC96827.1 MAG: glycosyltransferase [Mesorhizobium sp.]
MSREAAADITVVIPAKNAVATIDAALGSLAPDGALIREVLLVDDGCDDRTAIVAAESAVRHGLPLEVVAGRFGGAGAARNAGMARACGRFLFFLDADDEVIEGGLTQLREAFERHPKAGLAVGASIRRTAGRPDKMKTPHGYGSDRTENTRRYLRNELWPIAMGSALVARAATAGIRFPEAIGLDEDTCFWTAVLARADVISIAAPVLLYHLDETRMARRFITAPRATFLAVALALNRLAAHGVDRKALQWRKAWIAQRIARQLIKHRMIADAGGMMRAVRAHEALGRARKAWQYRARIRLARLAPARPPAPSLPASGRPRRTLVVCHEPAFPPVSGADLRNFDNAMAAAELGPVRLVSIQPRADDAQPLVSAIRVAALTNAGEPRAPALGWRRARGEGRIPRPALTRLKALVREFRPDTIIVEGIALFRLLRPLRPLAGQLVLDMHNVESDLAGQLERADGSRVSAPGLNRLERKAAGIVDRIWVCSRLDRERLSSGTAPIDVVPNGIPRAEAMPAALPAQPTFADGFPVVLLVGHLGYRPNVEAAERLVRNILPRIRQALPAASVVLAGRSPKPAVRALAGLDGVSLVEEPGDTRPLLAKAHLSIVPLSSGGGTRIKILEAMACGVPVVATPLAVEGLDLIEDEEVLLSESDEGLADMAIALCSDPARLARQRARAHATVWARFGPQAIRDAVRDGLGPDGAGQ